MYTWNWHTGVIDRFASNTGLEFVGWVLEPGIWVQNKTKSLWNNYIALVGVGRENRRLKQEISKAKLQIF
ncbi:MAG: rod shape-determining protein MreC, partial [Thermodesulfobacteriota bacterium]